MIVQSDAYNHGIEQNYAVMEIAEDVTLRLLLSLFFCAYFSFRVHAGEEQHEACNRKRRLGGSRLFTRRPPDARALGLRGRAAVGFTV